MLGKQEGFEQKRKKEKTDRKGESVKKSVVPEIVEVRKTKRSEKKNKRKKNISSKKEVLKKKKDVGQRVIEYKQQKEEGEKQRENQEESEIKDYK